MKASGSLKSESEVDCLDRQVSLNMALSEIMKEEIKDPASAIYYVNTRRLQKADSSKQYIKKDFLNQFTFAVCPADKDTAEAGKFMPVIV